MQPMAKLPLRYPKLIPSLSNLSGSKFDNVVTKVVDPISSQPSSPPAWNCLARYNRPFPKDSGAFTV